MTPAQHRPARRRHRPPAGAYLRSFARALDYLVERVRGTGDLDLITGATCMGSSLAG
jgi:hypothetical protein